jgi:hypothetical protein
MPSSFAFTAPAASFLTSTNTDNTKRYVGISWQKYATRINPQLVLRLFFL